jgi:hypothetical protein
MILDTFDIWIIERLLQTKYYQGVFKSIEEAQNAHQKVFDYSFAFIYQSDYGPVKYVYEKRELLGKFHTKTIPFSKPSDLEFWNIYRWKSFYTYLFDQLKLHREMANRSRDAFFTVQLPNGLCPEIMVRQRNYPYKEILQLYFAMMGGLNHTSNDGRHSLWAISAAQLCPNEAPLSVFLYQTEATQKEMFAIGLQKRCLFGLDNLKYIQWLASLDGFQDGYVQLYGYMMQHIHTLSSHRATEEDIEQRIVFLLRWFIFITYLFSLDELPKWKQPVDTILHSFVLRTWNVMGQDPNMLPEEVKGSMEQALQFGYKMNGQRGAHQNNSFGIQNQSISQLFRSMMRIYPEMEEYNWSFWYIWEASERYWQHSLIQAHSHHIVERDVPMEIQWILTLFHWIEQRQDGPPEHMSWMTYFNRLSS